MKKKRSASSARARQRAKSVKHMPDSRLDLSDIPEATDEQLRRARRVGRPVTGNAKQLIAIRIAPRLLAQLRRLAARQSKPYQTLIHELLERAAGKKEALDPSSRNCWRRNSLNSDERLARVLTLSFFGYAFPIAR